MDATKIPKLQSKEINSDGRPINLPGVYRHKDTGSEFITTSDYDAGVAQADALMTPLWKDAWERIGDVPSRTEVLTKNRAQLIKDTAIEGTAKRAEEAEFAAAVKAAEDQVAKTTKGPVSTK